MSLSKPEMVLIDLDGTLVDSVPDLALCIDETMKALNLPERGEQKVRTWVGNGLTRLIERALSDDINGSVEPELYDRALPIFMSLYRKNKCIRSQLYDHVIEGLSWFKSQAIPMGVVTNKDEEFTLPILEQLGLSPFFDIVISGDTLAVKKPNPAPLEYGANFFDIQPEKALMIGDSINDIKAARAAGFSIVCVSYGYNHGSDINSADTDAVIDSFAELSSLF